jgi:site-specific recombinase XerD
MTPLTITPAVFDSTAQLEEAELTAVAFLTRYSDPTRDAYTQDLRCYFQWAHDAGLDVLAVTRAHIELYRTRMEERGLAPSTIDRRLSTVCGYYRFAHIDGRITANPAQ